MTDILPAPPETAPSVVIAIPSHDLCSIDFARFLASLVGFTAVNHPEIRVRTLVCKATIIQEARHKLVHTVLQWPDVTHILWLDSDMCFPKDTLTRLLSHDKDIVGCNYATRRQPVIPTASTTRKDILLFDEGQTELIEVNRCGLGVVLTKRSVFDTMKAPWFIVGFQENEHGGGYYGEDVFFAYRAREAGLKVWVDPVLSRDLVHQGYYDYTLENATMTKAVLETAGEIPVAGGIAANQVIAHA